METFLFNGSLYLAAAVIAVPIAARLGLGSVLGYLLAGLAIGPVLGLVGDTSDLQHVAEFGVVMMLFLIGLELEPRTLWEMRHRLLGLGGLQILCTTAAVAGAAMAMDLDIRTSLAIGLVMALSSTAIVLQTLTEKGLVQTRGGRSAFSVLLTQDIAVIPILVLLPLLAISGPEVLHDDGHGGASIVADLPRWGAALVTLSVVVGIVLAGTYLTRPVFRYIHAANLREMYTALALLIVVGIAALMLMVGLSPALGAFLAGVVLANSEFRHELESDVEPFKGLLLGLFFITVGAGIDTALLFETPAVLISLALGLMAIKGVILYGLGRLFGLRRRALWLFTLGLAQAGEFGFVLISFSLQAQVLPVALGDQLLLIVALSMLFTPLSFLAYEFLAKRIGDAAKDIEQDEINEDGPVIIAGIGRFGQIVNRLVQSAGHKTVVLDHDITTIELMRTFGYRGFLGDPTRPDVLRAAGLAQARVLVVALDDRDAATRLTAYARRERPDLHIITRARSRNHVYDLYKAGANDIVRELFDSSLRAGRYVLENIGLSEFEAAAAERTFYQHDRLAVRELAKLWDPEVPTARNAEYLARAKELDAELETALAAALDESAPRKQA